MSTRTEDAKSSAIRSPLRVTGFLLRAACIILIFGLVCPAQSSAQGVWRQQQELTASDGVAYDHFGTSVAVSGNIAVVGATYRNNYQGAAYVFVKSGGTWIQQAELTPSNGTQGAYFGYSVAVDRGTVVVGAPVSTIGSNKTQGAAYVFVQNNGTWIQQAVLTAFDGAAGDIFGSSVAVSGRTVVVGAYYHTVGSNPAQGAAYVFARSGGTWSQQVELTAPDGKQADNFGTSVATSGSKVVVGAPQHPVVYGYQGAAYVFARSGGKWGQQAELTASDGAYYDLFGTSVAAHGSMVVVGAPIHDRYEGAAYVFAESCGTWSQQAELTASDGTFGDDHEFGVSVAVSGGTAVVGTPMAGYQGQAYVFVEDGGTWIQQAELTPSGGGAFREDFGTSVAASGRTVAVGAPQQNFLQGAAYVFGNTVVGEVTAPVMKGGCEDHESTDE